MKVVVLSGGGGGARFARGVHDALGADGLTVIGNVGDDVEILGLSISPDLDSILYLLAGLLDDERGWGRSGETWQALGAAGFWGGETWFRLGDLDLGLHLVRTRALAQGDPLSRVTADLVSRAGVEARILPATDDVLRTRVETPAGAFGFQEWFVGRAHEDDVDEVVYEGADTALPAPGVLDALARADAILIAPSNPFLSIGPILAVAAIRDAIAHRRTRCVAVSPLVGGKAVTGPLDRMLSRMLGGTTPDFVARSYEGLIDALVIDEADAPRGREDGARGHADPDARSRRRTPAGGDRPGGRVRVAIVGGTGPFGRALAIRLRKAADVVIGSRDGGRAAETARELGVDGATNADAVRGAELVVLATNAAAALETALSLKDEIGTTPVLSVASELRFAQGQCLPCRSQSSLAEQLQAELDAPVVAGLHSLAASTLGDETPPDEDVFVCGDDPEAKALVLGLAEEITTGHAYDAGPLASSLALECLTAVIVNLNRRYGGHAGIKVTGLS